MGARITISRNIIPWLKELAGPDAPEEAILEIEAWGSGRKPTLNQIDGISRKLHIPFGYFFLQEPCTDGASSPRFRSFSSRISNRISDELRDTISKMEEIQDWLVDYADEEDLHDCLIAAIRKEGQSPAALAAEIIARSGLGNGWNTAFGSAAEAYKQARETLGHIGIYIFENGIVGFNTGRKLDIGEFRAFCLYEKRVPLIFINASDSPEGKLFSLFHEAVHIALGEDDILCGSMQSQERYCNAAAAEMLMPSELFIASWKEGIAKNADASITLKSISRRFCTSISATAIRANELGLIGKAETDSIISEAKDRFLSRKKAASGGNFYSTARTRLDRNFLFMLYGNLQSGKTRYTDAYRLTSCSGAVFSRIMQEVLR